MRLFPLPAGPSFIELLAAGWRFSAVRAGEIPRPAYSGIPWWIAKDLSRWWFQAWTPEQFYWLSTEARALGVFPSLGLAISAARVYEVRHRKKGRVT